MEKKNGLDFICKEKFSDDYFKKIQVGHKFIWCDSCFDNFRDIKNFLFDKYRVLVTEHNDYEHIAEVIETKHSVIEKIDEERIKNLSPVVFNTNDLGW